MNNGVDDEVVPVDFYNLKHYEMAFLDCNLVPNEIWNIIFGFVPFQIRGILLFVCKKWQAILPRIQQMDILFMAKHAYINLMEWSWEKCGEYLQDRYRQHICIRAVVHGHVDVLKWALEHKCVLNKYVFSTATKHNRLEISKLLKKHNCPWDTWTLTKAAEQGSLELVIWL